MSSWFQTLSSIWYHTLKQIVYSNERSANSLKKKRKRKLNNPVKSTLQNTKYQAEIEGIIRPLYCEKWCQQVVSLSCLLFNLALDKVIKDINEDT